MFDVEDNGFADSGELRQLRLTEPTQAAMLTHDIL
jgi:hypothetical protein